MTPDEAIILAAPHFSITKEGELSRDSLPFVRNGGKQARLGVGFDTLNKSTGYFCFKYRHIQLGPRVDIKSHRMVYYLFHSVLPPEVDHIDQVKVNNNPSNLRSATRSQNQMNVSSQKNSTNLFLGVSKHSQCSRWQADIRINGKGKYLGLFSCPMKAAEAYNIAALERDKDFANLNKLS